jgi:GH25 family lysozyme M1 (1,4-beta-N-acetylmuramidase)
MPTLTLPQYQYQADIAGEEAAIRHLIGEKKALTSHLDRQLAHGKLAVHKTHRPVESPSKAKPTSEFPHGDRFPDVSSYQVHVDLEAVHKDESIKVGELVVVKSSEGLDYVDGFLASRWHGAHEAGFAHRGAYHFLHPELSGSEQAEYMLRAIESDGRSVTAQDILICDAEVSDGQPAAKVAQCVAEFGAYLLGHSPAKRWLYTGGPFAEEFGLKLAPYDGHWLPAYVADPKPYYVFGTPIAWQYTDGVHGGGPKSVEGIGACDVSVIL